MISSNLVRDITRTRCLVYSWFSPVDGPHLGISRGAPNEPYYANQSHQPRALQHIKSRVSVQRGHQHMKFTGTYCSFLRFLPPFSFTTVSNEVLVKYHNHPPRRRNTQAWRIVGLRKYSSNAVLEMEGPVSLSLLQRTEGGMQIAMFGLINCQPGEPYSTTKHIIATPARPPS